MNPLSTSDAPDLVKKGRVYIKDGKRKISSSDGVMHMSSSRSKQIFGKLKGGRYSKLQER
jgi:hypothetical protein